MTASKSGRRVKGVTPRCCRPKGSRLGLATEPAWSPNGKRIAYVGDDRIFTITGKGKKHRRLTAGERHNGMRFEDGSPSWSPDGTQIAFFRIYRTGRSDLFVVDADGSNLRAIETPEIGELDPAWSPDGEWIAFLGNEYESGLQGIYRMRPDGGDLQLVLALNDLRDGIDWSPDGKLLVFSTRVGAPPEIHTVRPDGTDRRKLTSQPRPAHGAVFSPSGKRIAFTVAGVLKVMDSDGGDVRRLLKRRRADGDLAPSWRPR
jgi:TolB protein